MSPARSLERISLAVLASVAFLGLAGSSEAAAGAPAGFDVVDYVADLTPDLGSQTVTGEVAIQLVSREERLSGVELACGNLAIESVTDAGRPLPHEVRGGRL